MNLVASIYSECNDHLRETDKKRDQLIGAYIICLGLFFTNIDRINGIGGNTLLVLICVCALSVFVLTAVIHYGRWHIIYVRSAQAVSLYMLLSGSTFSSKQRIDAYKHAVSSESEDESSTPGYMTTKWKLLNPFSSTETAIFIILVILTFIPIQMLIGSLKIIVIPYGPPYLPALGNFVIYSVLAVSFAYLQIHSAVKLDPFTKWLLEPLQWASDRQPSADSE